MVYDGLMSNGAVTFIKVIINLLFMTAAIGMVANAAGDEITIDPYGKAPAIGSPLQVVNAERATGATCIPANESADSITVENVIFSVGDGPAVVSDFDAYFNKYVTIGDNNKWITPEHVALYFWCGK